jgi:pyridoxal phosphate enzyme (YggS family)
VSKTHAASKIRDAYAAGQRHFGENRVQEGAAKIDELRAAGIVPTWHLLGHLQTNKVKAALGLFDILHGVDSERLASVIGARAEAPVRIFLEVNVAGEDTKSGVAPSAAASVAEAIGRIPNIELMGLMTVAPMVDDPEDVRPVFRTLRELRDAIGLAELSMGMTDDYEVAVEEGATFVRVGRAIFGPREG